MIFRKAFELLEQGKTLWLKQDPRFKIVPGHMMIKIGEEFVEDLCKGVMIMHHPGGKQILTDSDTGPLMVNLMNDWVEEDPNAASEAQVAGNESSVPSAEGQEPTSCSNACVDTTSCENAQDVENMDAVANEQVAPAASEGVTESIPSTQASVSS